MIEKVLSVALKHSRWIEYGMIWGGLIIAQNKAIDTYYDAKLHNIYAYYPLCDPNKKVDPKMQELWDSIL